MGDPEKKRKGVHDSVIGCICASSSEQILADSEADGSTKDGVTLYRISGF